MSAVLNGLGTGASDAIAASWPSGLADGPLPAWLLLGALVAGGLCAVLCLGVCNLCWWSTLAEFYPGFLPAGERAYFRVAPLSCTDRCPYLRTAMSHEERWVWVALRLYCNCLLLSGVHCRRYWCVSALCGPRL